MTGICDGRVVIVTGAGRGLGRAYAELFAREGARVVVNDLGTTGDGRGAASEVAEEVASALRAGGGRAIANGDDVTTTEGAGRLVGAALDAWGRLDVLVNNAGFVRDRMFVSATEEEWDAVLRVHLRGHFCPAQRAVAYFRDRAKAGEKLDARIINTTSGAGLFGSVGQSAYSTAKAGIIGLTLVQAAELARYGVTANAIAPAARTRMTEAVFADMMKRPDEGFDEMAPENVAPLVVWLGSKESRGITGRVFEAEAGRITLGEGYKRGARRDKGARWEPAELGEIVAELVAQTPPPTKAYGAT
ncbi:MAG: SDR family oxidoreductase [Polyangiaceae bacterium]|nr:SDR family oxidoreductase [Polyangiaceae bacterium]